MERGFSSRTSKGTSGLDELEDDLTLEGVCVLFPCREPSCNARELSGVSGAAGDRSDDPAPAYEAACISVVKQRKIRASRVAFF